MDNWKSRQGFTLVELMIVVAIMGILAALAIPKFGAMMARAHDAQTLGNLGVLRSALSIYYANTEGVYPSFPPPFGTPSGYNSFFRDAMVPTYIAEIPVASPSGSHHPSSNLVDHVWNQTGSEDDEGNGYGKGWKYDANPFDPQWGSLLVLCTHQTAKGINWSTF